MARLLKYHPSTKFVATPPERKSGYGGNFFGLDRNVFHNRFNVFWITRDLTFRLVNLIGVEGNYLEEGHCETFE